MGGSPSPHFLEVRAVLKVRYAPHLAKGLKVLRALAKENDEREPGVEPPSRKSMPISLEQSKVGRESQNHTGTLQTANQPKDSVHLKVPG